MDPLFFSSTLGHTGLAAQLIGDFFFYYRGCWEVVFVVTRSILIPLGQTKMLAFDFLTACTLCMAFSGAWIMYA